MPSIRFHGFDNDWEQRKLGDDLVSIHTGTNLLGSITNTGMPLIKMGNIQRGYFDTSKVEFLAENEQLDKADIANYGDFFFNTRNTLELVGKGATWMKNSGEYAFNSNIARFELRNLDTIFFNYLYNTDYMTKQIHARAMGTTSVAAIYPRTLDSVEYLAPCMKEQQKIGAYFKQLDHLITLHQRKFEKLTNVKKSMLEKMFPKDGADVPEVRFKGFTGVWEQRKAKELFVSTADKGYPELPVLSATQDRGMIRRDENSINIFHDKKNEAGYKRVLPGQFVIHLRSFQGGFAHSAIEGITSPAYTVFGFSEPEKHDSEYWKYVFTSKAFIRRLETVTYGIRDGRSISYDEFLTLSFVYPSRSEQTAIAQYLDKLSNLITLHQCELEKFQNLKKALLEKMFV